MIKKIHLILFAVIFSLQTIAQKTKVSDSDLSPMNRVDMDIYVDLTNNVDREEFKILIIGNSLTRHGVLEEIGWFHEHGMAASSKEKDYVHILFRKLEKLFPNKKIHLRMATGVGFERNVIAYNFDDIDKIKKDFNPNFIIFQLSENIPSNINLEVFKAKYIEYINRFKKQTDAITLCTTPFFLNTEKSTIIKKVCVETNSFLIDLSSLVLSDKQNYAKDDENYPGVKTTWKVAGIGMHPGDYGMKNIAELMFITINAVSRMNVKLRAKKGNL